MSSLSFIVISLIIFDITVLNEELLLYVLINPIKILSGYDSNDKLIINLEYKTNEITFILNNVIKKIDI